jgi:cell division protein FtsB
LGKGVLVLLVFAAILASVKQPLHEQNAMRAKLALLEQEADGLREDRDKLLRRLNWIQTDTGYLELEVRDRLNLQKGGEFVLRFED